MHTMHKWYLKRLGSEDCLWLLSASASLIVTYFGQGKYTAGSKRMGKLGLNDGLTVVDGVPRGQEITSSSTSRVQPPQSTVTKAQIRITIGFTTNRDYPGISGKIKGAADLLNRPIPHE
ncbi:unnamed protein product [Rhizoctonia solani]|uniref:Uncharacterized protein n=1 Tax=Rhizoctonia solani TaxID=456999 RepID=A0A8H3BBU1_9AGAM|nr:unnamed protein product [Rhizoctonia solani]